jgi:NAD+ kinase
MSELAASPPKHIGVTFNPHHDGARDLAHQVVAAIQKRGVAVTLDDETTTEDEMTKADLVICLGGDGSVLRCTRRVVEHGAAILGVNLGRLGFLTEMDGAQILDRLDDIIEGRGRIEERMMLEAGVRGQGVTFAGLNEAVVGRATLSRAIQLAVDVDGIRVADYRCDGVIVATATGSTAYALSVGGPILYPESSDLIVVPVAPHLSAEHAVIVPGNETVHITLEPDQHAVLSVDGLADVQLHAGDSVQVKASPHRARFLRFKPRTDFYIRMAAQLGWHRPGGNAKPLPPFAG